MVGGRLFLPLKKIMNLVLDSFSINLRDFRESCTQSKAYYEKQFFECEYTGQGTVMSPFFIHKIVSQLKLTVLMLNMICSTA